jgi:hypothetical protein
MRSAIARNVRGKFFDREFSFARSISEEVWREKKDATVFVYPRYFSTREVPGFGVSGSRQGVRSALVLDVHAT